MRSPTASFSSGLEKAKKKKLPRLASSLISSMAGGLGAHKDELSKEMHDKMELYSTQSRASASVLAKSRADEVIEDHHLRLGPGIGDRCSGGWKSNEKESRL